MAEQLNLTISGFPLEAICGILRRCCATESSQPLRMFHFFEGIRCNGCVINTASRWNADILNNPRPFLKGLLTNRKSIECWKDCSCSKPWNYWAHVSKRVVAILQHQMTGLVHHKFHHKWSI
jgi:hypothetical protein